MKCIVLIASVVISISASQCPNDSFLTKDNQCLRVIHDMNSFKDGIKSCKGLHGNGASVHSVIEQSALRNLANGCTKFWLGGLRENQKLVWLDGTQFDYSNFLATNDDGYIAVETNTGRWELLNDTKACTACEVPIPKRDCQGWYDDGFKITGMYDINVGGISRTVWCDMDSYGGGWTLVQSRVDEKLSFWDKTWNEYKNGFGDLESKNYWLGNEVLHQLTFNQNMTLRVELYGDRTPSSRYADDFWFGHYFSFQIYSEADNYKLQLKLPWQHVVGNATTGWYDLSYSDGAPFSTVDRINDRYPRCVTEYKMGGWWMHNCALSTLNGKYDPSPNWDNGYGMFWIINGQDYLIRPRGTRMLVRQSRE